MVKRDMTFKKGERVRYVPSHVYGQVKHPDCEDGVVSSVSDKYVFVKYDNAVMKMVTGDEPYTAAATHYQDLVKIAAGRDE